MKIEASIDVNSDTYEVEADISDGNPAIITLSETVMKVLPKAPKQWRLSTPLEEFIQAYGDYYSISFDQAFIEILEEVVTSLEEDEMELA